MELTETRRGVLASASGLAGAVAFGVHADAQEAPLARTSYGPVRGYLDSGIKVFKGVRYGADTGPRRFMPPLPPTLWTEPASATAYGPASPQAGGERNQSEDCLFLNVWTPGLRDGGKRPVMVYIHGGAYASGSGSSPLYEGARLCRRARAPAFRR